MASHLGLNPLKSWRWVGIFAGPQLMIVAGKVRVGPARQNFYAVWDGKTLHEGAGSEMVTGRLRIPDHDVDVELAEGAGVETITGPTWTRKQAGIAAVGRIGDTPIDSRAFIDDSAGYHARHTDWRWCAGVGVDTDGHQLAWNLVNGVHDSLVNSERTVWVDDIPSELSPTVIAADLRSAGDLHFEEFAVREANENRLIVRSRYRQPFGTFSGEIAGHTLASGCGVMEEHDVYW
jgi:hypothetical protein